MCNAHTRRQLLGNRFDELVERVLVPVHEVLGRALLLDLLELLRVAGGLHLGLVVLDLVLGGLGYDHTLGVEARTTRATGDLMELAAAQTAHLATVELGELREHHGMDGHVDADAQRIGAADDGQQALLRKLFHQQTVTRQHAGMVHAHAAAQQALQRFAERRGELRALHGLLDRLALLLGCHAVACQVLRAGERRILREMDDVQRALVLAQRKLDRSLERGERVFVR